MLILSFVVPIFIFTFSAVMQILKMKKTRSSRDVSLLYVLAMAVGITFSFLMCYLTDSPILVLVERGWGVLLGWVVFSSVLYWRQ